MFPCPGVFIRRGVGDGERDGDGRFRLDSCLGVRMSLVALCPSLAKSVISGISENVLKHVSSTVDWSWVGI
jgi:hypothetical protein